MPIALETGATLLQGYYLGRPASSTEWLAGEPSPIAATL
jgi:EAL domain-containing protein (putative c-di-GMP-specific phosphodiesterase class I)